MKRAQLLGFSVALSAAIGAFVFANSVMTPPPAPTIVESTGEDDRSAGGGI